MKRFLSILAIAFAALVLSLAAPGTSSAGGSHGHKQHYSKKHGFGHGHRGIDRRYRDHRFGYGYRSRSRHFLGDRSSRYFGPRRHHRRDHYYGHRKRHKYRHNHRRRHHGGHSHYRGSHYSYGFSYYRPWPYYGYSSYYSYGYRPYYYRPYYAPRVIYVDPPVAYQQPSYSVAPSVQAPPPPPDGLPANCRMIREYQTQITVGGRLVDAYGDACLMPDGSWERGPPKVVPDY